jgi:hypothetical protein
MIKTQIALPSILHETLFSDVNCASKESRSNAAQKTHERL